MDPSYDFAKALEYLGPLQLAPPSLSIDAIEDRSVRVQPDVGPHAAALLDLLVRILRPRRILEIGTCLGYAACALGRAARETGGEVVSLEIDSLLAEVARRNVHSLGLESVVEIRNEDARRAIDAFAPGSFGLILQDGGKDDYLPMLERLVDLLEPGGLLVTDDVLFPVMDLPSRAKPWGDAIDDYNRRLRDRSDLRTVWLPIGDGVAVSRKES